LLMPGAVGKNYLLQWCALSQVTWNDCFYMKCTNSEFWHIILS
jgi:hypothetical protein